MESTQLLTSHLTNQVRLARHDRNCFSTKDELISDFLLWIPNNEHSCVGWLAKTYIYQQRICLERYSIGMEGERESREYIFLACLDVDDHVVLYVFQNGIKIILKTISERCFLKTFNYNLKIFSHTHTHTWKKKYIYIYI